MTTYDIQCLNSNLKLSQKIDILQKFVSKYHFAENGIAYSMLYDGENEFIRPWRNQDLCGISKDSVIKSDIDWLNNENSTMFSGVYLQSQVYRFEVEKSEDSMNECCRALNSLRKISELAGTERFGWLCKPFGMACSNTSSPDQNVNAINGMLAFLQYANKNESDWIKTIIPAIAEYWENKNYTIEFDGRIWDMRRDLSHMKIFQAINEIAWKISGKTKFSETAKRLFSECGDVNGNSASLFDSFCEVYPDYFDDWRLVSEFAGATALFSTQTINILSAVYPENSSRYLAGLKRAMHHSLIGFNCDYSAHYYLTEVKKQIDRYFWRPLSIPSGYNAITANRIRQMRFPFDEYPNRLFWFDATSRLPLLYTTYLKMGGERQPYYEGIVIEIMNKLDFVRLHWMVDRQTDQIIPELAIIRNALTSEIPNYIAAYWLGKKNGLWE